MPDNSRVILYDRNMFKIQANGQLDGLVRGKGITTLSLCRKSLFLVSRFIYCYAESRGARPMAGKRIVDDLLMLADTAK